MVPSFGSREALPELALNQPSTSYELSVPHPSLGCGFSASAFTNKELSALPQWLQATGTIVHWDTGYLTPGSVTYCPFLTFERAYGNKEHRVETANNQSAIAGSYCIRALQMLYARTSTASTAYQMAEAPVAFSCTIDNTFALLNLHWIDLAQGQSYCMAPLCQFDLSKDTHFSKFLVWTQAIGDWALSHVLPSVKEALDKFQRSSSPVTPAPFYPIRRPSNMRATPLRLDTGPALNKDELLISSLKTTFENIPWRYEDDVDSGVSSSTASWGSPMVNDFAFSNLSYPTVHPPRSNGPMSAPNSSVVARRRIGRTDPPRSPIAAPPVHVQQAQDGVWQKRFNQAMEEIKDLQTQLQAFQMEMQGLKSSLREEVAQCLATSPSRPQLRGGDVDEAIFVEFTPVTPKASIPPASILTVKHPELISDIITKASPVWRVATIALSGHVLAQCLPGRATRLLAYGCVANACLIAFVRPSLPQDLGLGLLKKTKTAFGWLRRSN